MIDMVALIDKQTELAEWFKRKGMSHSEAMAVISVFVAISIECGEDSDKCVMAFDMAVCEARHMVRMALKRGQ